jgi:hypothetical protein
VKDKKTLFGQIEKIKQSTQTVSDLRLSPFMPIQKISNRSVTYQEFKKNKNILRRETAFGTIEIRNRLLTQHHSDIFHYIMANKKDIKDYEDGKVILFSLYDIAKAFGYGWGGKTSKEVEELIQQIADCRIVRYNKENKPVADYKIIHWIKYSEKQDVWGILLTKEYLQYFYSELSLDYAKRIDEIIAISGEGNGLIKAIINHFITHKANDDKENGSIKIQRASLMELLNTVNYPKDTKRQVTSAKSIIKRMKNQLEKFNIKYYPKDELFEYGGTENINFISAIKSQRD